MLNFYTERMLRCNIQPSVPIHLRVLDAFPPSGDGKYTPQNDDDDQYVKGFFVVHILIFYNYLLLAQSNN